MSIVRYFRCVQDRFVDVFWRYTRHQITARFHRAWQLQPAVSVCRSEPPVQTRGPPLRECSRTFRRHHRQSSNCLALDSLMCVFAFS